MNVFLLGLDGMTLRIVEPYIKAGLLPSFQKVMNNGSYGVLHSTIPPSSPLAWTSLATGKNPGKHGIYEFRKRNGYTTEIITKSISPYANPMWNVLSRHGKKVVIANVPFFYPPDKVNGIMVSGLMTPSLNAEFVYPNEEKKKILELIPNYQVDIGADEYVYSTDMNLLLKKIFEITEGRRNLMEYMLENHPWNLFFLVFTGPDRLQHFLWDEVTSMDRECVKYYQLLDEILGNILKRFDDETVLFIVSDHGFMEAKKSFYINTFLKESGLLEPRHNYKIKNSLAKLNISVANIRRTIKKTGWAQLKKHVPTPLINLVRRTFPSEGLKEGDFVHRKTKAFSLQSYGIISVNLKGREPKGIVERADYHNLCEVIINELLKVEDPETGKSIVKTVYKGELIYSNEYSKDRPDLLVIMNEGYSINQSLGTVIVGENRVGNKYRTGDHDEKGLFIAHGNSIIRERIVADIYDIMPTILYLMGAAIPEDVDGQVLTEIINPEFVKNHEIQFENNIHYNSSKGSALNGEETKKIENLLKNLGYMD